MYAIYVFFTNIVLVNLLVAMMVFSFNKEQADAGEEYKVGKFRFQKEFYNKPAIPNPFSFLVIFYRLFMFFYERKTGKFLKLCQFVHPEHYINVVQFD